MQKIRSWEEKDERKKGSKQERGNKERKTKEFGGEVNVEIGERARRAKAE